MNWITQKNTKILTQVAMANIFNYAFSKFLRRHDKIHNWVDIAIIILVKKFSSNEIKTSNTRDNFTVNYASRIDSNCTIYHPDVLSQAVGIWERAIGKVHPEVMLKVTQKMSICLTESGGLQI